ncbi:DMT family transporter [Chromatiaceae bacterium AAb-1]|nr:DMT family transporter [Chromatiaceae bacterium AAb-1]
MISSDKPAKGIIAMIIAVAMFSAMDAAMKALTPYYSAMQITCLRGLFAWPLVLLWLISTGQAKYLLQARWSLHVLRAVLGIVMLASFVFSLKTLSLGDAYAIFFSCPLLITVLSVWWLKEKVAPRHWVAIGVGLATVIYMLKPDTGQFLSIGALAALVAAFCYAVSAITVRVLAKSDTSGNMVFWLMTFLIIGAGALSWPVWQPLQSGLWHYFLVIGVTGFIGQICLTEAFKLAPASVIAPFEYTALLWGIGFDILLWQQWPALSLLIGAAIIMSSGLYLLFQERR